MVKCDAGYALCPPSGLCLCAPCTSRKKNEMTLSFDTIRLKHTCRQHFEQRLCRKFQSYCKLLNTLAIHATALCFNVQRWDTQAPYPSSISMIPSGVGAARGSKITLKLPGRVTDESVMFVSSIGDLGSGLTVRAHRISAVSRNTDLLTNSKQMPV
jgi:hypothetical protein